MSGAYHVFVQPLITSARKFFLKGIADLEVVVVSDRLPSYSPGSPEQVCSTEREFFVDNLLVRIHFIIVMIWWTGLAP